LSASIVESRSGRRIIGRLVAGEDVIERLLAVIAETEVRAATIQLSGVVDELALVHYDRGARAMGKARWYRAPLSIISCSGTLAERDGKADLVLQVVASRAGDNGIEVIGGRAVNARVVAAEFVIDAMDDVMLRRWPERGSGLSIWQELIGAPPATPEKTSEAQPKKGIEVNATAQGAAQWAVAVAASAEAQEESVTAELAPDREPYHAIKAGDFLEHTKFGRCVIEKVDANEEFATVRLRNKRLVRLNIEILDLIYKADEEGHQVFGPRNAR